MAKAVTDKNTKRQRQFDRFAFVPTEPYDLQQAPQFCCNVISKYCRSKW